MKFSEIEKVLRMSRAYAAEILPWFAPALYAARLVITEKCPFIAGVDEGMRVYFNPQMVAQKLEQNGIQKCIPQLAWIWIHEVCHGLREHPERAKEKKAKHTLWNIAADLEINDDEWEGLERPPDALLPRDFRLPKGMLAEFYYDKLLSNKLSRSKAILDEGSGVHGQPREWELPPNDPEAPSLTDLEKEVMRREVSQEIIRRKNQGKIPGGWLRWAEEILKPKVNWRELLKRKIRGAITVGIGRKMDYSFFKPHRRTEIYRPVLLPSLQGDLIPRVACVVDTSGSISKEELAQALAEVKSILEVLRVPVTVIPCDAVPYEPIKVFVSSRVLRLRLQGGGGTNMVAGIEAALSLKPTPDVVIVLTDGYTPFPTRRYEIPVIFGIFAEDSKENIPKPPMPPWKDGDVVVIPLRW